MRCTFFNGPKLLQQRSDNLLFPFYPLDISLITDNAIGIVDDW